MGSAVQYSGVWYSLLQCNLKVDTKETTTKMEVFNFNDKEGQKVFKELTSDNTVLSSIFDSNKSVNKQAKFFLKRLTGLLHQSFKKIKIKGVVNKKEDALYTKQKELKQKSDEESKRKLKLVEDQLAELK